MNAVVRTTSTTAVVSLVFGILAWVGLPVLGAVVAVVTGSMARGEIRRAGGTIDGDGMALAGLVLGWVQLVLCFLALLAVAGFLLLAVMA